MNVLEFVAMPQVLITIAALIVLLWRISDGYKNGLICEILGIAGIAIGVVILILSADAISKIISHTNLPIIKTVVQIAVVILVYKIIKGISRAVRGSREIPILSTVNRLLGAAFGVVEAGFWGLIIQRIVGYRIDSAIYFTINQITSCIREIVVL